LRPDGNALNSFVRSESDTQTSGEEVWIFLADVASYLIISLTKHSEKKLLSNWENIMYLVISVKLVTFCNIFLPLVCNNKTYFILLNIKNFNGTIVKSYYCFKYARINK